MSTNQQPAKPLTPAQTAKPYGTASKAAAAKKSATTAAAEAPAPESGAPANDETVKAVERLQTQTKAVYVTLAH